MAHRGRPLWDSAKSAEENASRKLPSLVRAYFRAGQALFAAKAAAGVLHKFRLETKRFRYTLELFQPCYGPGLEERLKLLRKIQDVLGEINDCAATRTLLKTQPAGISTFLERRMALKTSELRRCWQRAFGGGERESWWTNYLARFARRPKRTA